MIYSEFEDHLIEMLKKELPADTCIGTETVPRNRGGCLRGLTIHRCAEQVSPVIYLDECYRQYQDGVQMDTLVSDILQVCGQCGRITTDIADLYEDWNKVNARIVRRVVSKEGNDALLYNTPHRHFLDLAVVYYCVFESRDGFEAGVLIRNSHLQLWGKEQKDLEEKADMNMPVLCPPELHTMQEMLSELLGTDAGPYEETPGLYVLTNRSKCYGAVYMTDELVLQRISQRLGEDFYVLPSSLHECMVVPASTNSDETAMQRMVEEINCTQVAPEEVLGNSVYFYERSRGALRIAAAG